MEFTIESLNFTFRIAEMNAIEALALRNIIDFKNYKATSNMIKIILEHIEVKFKDEWYRVKEPDKNIYYPANIEKNVVACNELVNYFLNDYFKPLFRKSNESKD